MFGWIGKIKHHGSEDFSDIRANVLSDRVFEPPRAFDPQRPSDQQSQYPQRYDDFSPKTRDVFEPVETPSFPSSYEKPPEQTSRNYELMDRLNIMESQLAAIRSMTETINERLKNLEVRLGAQRRY